MDSRFRFESFDRTNILCQNHPFRGMDLAQMTTRVGVPRGVEVLGIARSASIFLQNKPFSHLTKNMTTFTGENFQRLC